MQDGESVSKSLCTITISNLNSSMPIGTLLISAESMIGRCLVDWEDETLCHVDMRWTRGCENNILRNVIGCQRRETIVFCIGLVFVAAVAGDGEVCFYHARLDFRDAYLCPRSLSMNHFV